MPQLYAGLSTFALQPMSPVEEKSTHTATIKTYTNDDGKYLSTSVVVSIPDTSDESGCLDWLLLIPLIGFLVSYLYGVIAR